MITSAGGGGHARWDNYGELGLLFVLRISLFQKAGVKSIVVKISNSGKTALAAYKIMMISW